MRETRDPRAVPDRRRAFETTDMIDATRQLQENELDRLRALAYRLDVSSLMILNDALELHLAASQGGGSCKAGSGLRRALMKATGETLRLAEWTVRPDEDGVERCQHVAYSEDAESGGRKIGSDKVAIGEIGDERWLEAWIA